MCYGLYNMKLDKMFVVEIVNDAIKLLEEKGLSAFNDFRSKSGDFWFLDTYVLVMDGKGFELVNPVFPNLEGRNLYDYKDRKGKYVIREIITLAEKVGAGWTTMMWPKPGESVPVKKLMFVRGTKVGKKLLIVGSGVYLNHGNE